MAGQYCRYCDRRCFVLRKSPLGRDMHLATCPEGAAHDREVLGVDYTTALNPLNADGMLSAHCPGCRYPNAPSDPDAAAAFSAQWHRDHQAAHLAAFPDLDYRSRQVLQEMADLAERREQEGATA